MTRNSVTRVCLLFIIHTLLACLCLHAQVLPQETINNALMFRQDTPLPVQVPGMNAEPSRGVYNLMKETPGKIKEINQRLTGNVFSTMTDTVFVGDVPGDTLVITGAYFNNGPLLVFNDGVLIFEDANATILGDIYVFQNGKMFIDSSVISSPQQYFYQRSLVIANNGYASISNSTLDFSGLSHNLSVVENGEIEMYHVHNIGFTTAGAFGNATISIDSTNQAGEFIMTDSAQFNFSNANTVLLWHHIPDGSVVDVAFPTGASVASYLFDNNQAGVAGIGYNVQVNNCTDVMWALMPENNSDVTITGSALRAIGLWFIGDDTVSVSGLVNNSTYASFSAPLTDRLLQLNTTSVQTWSLYLFDQVVLNVTGCIVGEVGSMGTSQITAQGILCDGSGGYYWGSDTSLNIAVSTTVTGYIRSQGNGIVLLAYGSATAGASAIGNSVMVVTQSTLPQDPIAFDSGTVWLVRITPPQNLFVDTIINISGSAWVDQGPLGSFMDFGYYTMEYAPVAIPGWISISSADSNEVHNGLLAQWDTHGLVPGSYLLRLKTLNSLGDSIDAVLQVTLLPSIVGTVEPIVSNVKTWYDTHSQQVIISIDAEEASDMQVEIYDYTGKLLYQHNQRVTTGSQEIQIPFSNFTSGEYILSLSNKKGKTGNKFMVVK